MTKLNINGQEYTIEELESLVKQSENHNPDFILWPNKPKQLFYPNGAVVNELEVGDIYYTVLKSEYDSSYYIQEFKWGNNHYDRSSLNEHLVFLREDLAERYIDYKQTHNRLLKKIIEINAENDWVVDWSDRSWDDDDIQSKYFCLWNCRRKGSNFDIWNRNCNIYMCEQAKDYMMSDQVSDEDFKKFLFIYD